MSQKIWRYISFVALVFATPLCAAQGRFDDANLTDFAAKKAETAGNIFSDTIISKIVYPVGTQFYITAIHPGSAWTLSPFSGKVATASTCTGALAGATDPGISILTYGDRKGYYVSCFYLAGNAFQYFIYGFKFSLANSTPTCNSPQILQNGQCVTPTPTCISPQILQNGQCVTPTPPSTPSSATYSNGTLVIKGLAVDGAHGRNYYNVTMRLKAFSNPLAFTVDLAEPSK